MIGVLSSSPDDALVRDARYTSSRRDLDGDVNSALSHINHSSLQSALHETDSPTICSLICLATSDIPSSISDGPTHVRNESLKVQMQISWHMSVVHA